VRLFFTDHYVLPLPEGHRFPMAKYARLRERVAAELVPPHELVVPDPASDADLLRAHAASYVERVVSGTLTRDEIRRIGFPWSAEMVERSRRSAGATLGACRAALREPEGIAVNLAGGTHHAFADRGEGYCVFNDTAVAARAMQAEERAERILVVDCDVHQGNGTASIFRGDPSVFTFSIHGAKNFPFRKETSDLDIELQDRTGDSEYAAALERGLGEALSRVDPDLALYIAGADPFEGDRLGRLRVSRDGLAARDRFVLETLRSRGIPVAVTMAGGYARNVDDTVAIHFETVRIAAALSATTFPPALLRPARSAPA
jgi:acetoin utilization deacetylase AcuC-like enzyme